MKITVKQLKQLIVEQIDTLERGGSFSTLDSEIEETKRRIAIRKEITATKEQIVELEYEILKLEKEKQRLKTENRKRIAALKSPADKSAAVKKGAETRANNKRAEELRKAEWEAEKKVEADRVASGLLPMDGYQIDDQDILDKYYDDTGDAAGPIYKLKPKFHNTKVKYSLRNNYSR